MAGYGAGLVVGLGVGAVALGALSVMRPDLGRGVPAVAAAEGGAAGSGATEAVGDARPGAEVSSSRQQAPGAQGQDR